MRILILCNRDLASNFALNLLLPTLSKHEARVALTERVGSINVSECIERRDLRQVEQIYPNEILFPLIERANSGRRTSSFDLCRGGALPEDPRNGACEPE